MIVLLRECDVKPVSLYTAYTTFVVQSSTFHTAVTKSS
jgi:hypothetical protein